MRLFIITIFTFLTLCTEVFASSVFITGGNQGIGFGFVKHYLKEGYKVYATYRLEEKSTALLKIKSDNLVPIQVDFENPDSALRHIKDVLKNDPLDILILNAGYFADKANKFGDLKCEDMQRSFTINTIFPLLLTQELKENILSGQDKKIVAISSRRASIQQTKNEKYLGRYGYRCSKTTLNAGMAALALEMPTVTVLILHPGRVMTAFTNFDPKGLTIDQSVRSMAERISTSTSSQSGKFYDYKGEELPW